MLLFCDIENYNDITMHTITFTCETITPMFLSGADGSTPELRAPSIKGALRFWWRAMNGHLSLEDLKEREGEIFGSTDKRSKVIILAPKITEKSFTKISGTPHHTNAYCDDNKSNCYFKNNRCTKSYKREASFFNFDLKVKYNNNAISESQLLSIFKATFLFGGFGKRSRRGFGSIVISQAINQDEKTLFSGFQSFDGLNQYIKDLKFSKNQDYPTLVSSKISDTSYNSYLDSLIKIGEATHLNSHRSNGHGGRFASPMYLSVVKTSSSDEFKIIATELYNTEFNETTTQNKNLLEECLK